MKKSILSTLVLAVLFSTAAGAAVAQTTLELNEFTGISIGGSFDVSIVKGTGYQAVVTVEDAFLPYLECKVNGRTLSIDLDERKVPSEVRKQFRAKGTPTPEFKALITVPGVLQSVALSDKAVLRDCDGVFDDAKVSINLTDNAIARNVDVKSQAVHIYLQNKSAGDFKVNSKVLEVEAGNNTNLRIEDNSDLSDYQIQGSTNVTATVQTATLKISAKGNSEMKLSGTASSAVYELSGTSEVSAEEFEVPDARVTMSSVSVLKQGAYKTLTVNLNGGSTLLFANDPVVTVENIKSSTMARISTGRKPATI